METRFLDLAYSNQTIEDVRRISRDYPFLEGINLSMNEIGDAGAIIISTMPRIQRVTLQWCGIGITGLQALLSNHNIVWISLADHSLDENCMIAISKAQADRKTELKIYLTDYDFSIESRASQAAIAGIMQVNAVVGDDGSDEGLKCIELSGPANLGIFSHENHPANEFTPNFPRFGKK
jgi:hypothetical protein